MLLFTDVVVVHRVQYRVLPHASSVSTACKRDFQRLLAMISCKYIHTVNTLLLNGYNACFAQKIRFSDASGKIEFLLLLSHCMPTYNFIYAGIRRKKIGKKFKLIYAAVHWHT